MSQLIGLVAGGVICLGMLWAQHWWEQAREERARGEALAAGEDLTPQEFIRDVRWNVNSPGEVYSGPRLDKLLEHVVDALKLRSRCGYVEPTMRRTRCERRPLHAGNCSDGEDTWAPSQSGTHLAEHDHR